MDSLKADEVIRRELVEFLHGGFAPSLILLQEFDYRKAAIILDGLHFSAWILLNHMKARQETLLEFMKKPEEHQEVWEDAYWSENHQPNDQQEWDAAIEAFAGELEKVIGIIRDPETDLFREYSNGKTVSWAAMAVFHHNAYHIGQLKTIGRQLGVW